jgi:hypothetical protein
MTLFILVPVGHLDDAAGQGSTHPGTGLPIVLLSARLATERILREVGAPRPALKPIPAAVG